MSGFRTPEMNRRQMVLWEHRLDDAIPMDHPVRHFDFLLDSESFEEVFRSWEGEYVLSRGAPPFHPRDLAGLYLYGMLHKIRSSRQLESACYSRLDVMWLLQGQKPDHSTIAAFVGKHGKHLRKLFRSALTVLIRAKLVKLDHVAIDGSKVEADAGKNSIRSEEKIRSWSSHLDDKIAALEKEWQENEKRETSLFGGSNPWTPPKGENERKALARLKHQQERLQKALSEIARRHDEHVGSKPPKRIASTTDSEARPMKDKEGRTKVNWNTQLAVDDAHGAVVAADLSDQPEDSGQLTPMVDQVTENCGDKPRTVTADSQYNTGPDLKSMEEKEIACYLPDAGKNSEAAPSNPVQEQALEAVREGRVLTEAEWAALPRNNRKLIDKAAFVYDQRKDQFRCPAGQTLTFWRTSQDSKRSGTVYRKQYGGVACASCRYATSCCTAPNKGRTINRDQYEEHRERLRERMATDAGRETYNRRKHTVEPAIGHIKHNMGIRRFLRRGIEKAKTEWTMICTAANLGILLRHWKAVAGIL